MRAIFVHIRLASGRSSPLAARPFLFLICLHNLILSRLIFGSFVHTDSARRPRRPAQERLVQEGLRARRTVFRRRRSHHLRYARRFHWWSDFAHTQNALCAIFIARSSTLFDASARRAQRWPSSEERAGHHVKLHEYCSTDVDGMVQRHLHVRSVFLAFGHG